MFLNSKTISTMDITPEVETLRPFDAVPVESLSSAHPIRAEARLEQIMATSPGQPIASKGRAPKRRLSTQQLAIRFGAIPVAAGAIIAATVLAPNGAGVAPAFASWTATPVALTGDHLAAASNACQATVGDLAGSIPNSAIANLTNLATGETLANSQSWQTFTEVPVISELRGDWAWLRFEDADLPQSARCMVVFVDDAPKVVWADGLLQMSVETVSGDRTSLRRFAGTGRGEFELLANGTEGGFVSMSNNIWMDSSTAPGTASATFIQEANLPDHGSYTLMTGRVGSDVVGLVVHTATGIDVSATITDDNFVAWWPDRAPHTGARIPAGESWRIQVESVTLTLADGTILPAQSLVTNPE